MAVNERQLSLRKLPLKLKAWDLYQRGVYESLKFTMRTNLEAERYFKEAIEADPDFASAYARLALVQQNNVFFGYTENPAELLDTALEAARMAISLDERDPLAHYAAGEVLIRKQDFDFAISALRKAIELNPSAALAYYGLGLAMYYSGRCADAIQYFDDALCLSPNAPERWAYFHLQARCHLDLGHYQDAYEYAGRALRQPNANTIALAAFAAAAAYVGQIDQAKSVVEDLLRRQPDFCVRYVLEHFGNDIIAEAMQHFATGLRKAGLPE
jgi:tetratricopeptide (TPR) repeat protein